jgi:hypothetical protein
MHPELITHSKYINSIPDEGYHILANQTDDEILVYQAYNHQIADFAIKHQRLGGNAFKYSRMSWIKPNFLWMMYRSGWASKPNQERILGFWLKKSDFDTILSEAVYSSFKSTIYPNQESWKAALTEKEVRLQWDPDHDVFGNKQARKAIQLGLKGEILKTFGTEMILKVIDMTEIAQIQSAKIKAKKLSEVMIPKEWSYEVKDINLRKKLQLI